jgi:hypothetical protein
VEPHALIEARLLDARVEPCEAKRLASDVEQGHVAGVGKRRLVEWGIVRQAAHRPYPRIMGHRRALRRIDDENRIHRRTSTALSEEPLPVFRPQSIDLGLALIELGGQALWPRHLRYHLVLMHVALGRLRGERGGAIRISRFSCHAESCRGAKRRPRNRRTRYSMGDIGSPGARKLTCRRWQRRSLAVIPAAMERLREEIAPEHARPRALDGASLEAIVVRGA